MSTKKDSVEENKGDEIAITTPLEKLKQRQRRQRRRTNKDPNKPKRSKSAFMFYSLEQRKRIVSENPDAKFGDIAKLTSAEFKQLSEKDKAKYEKLADKDSERYFREMKDYVPPKLGLSSKKKSQMKSDMSSREAEIALLQQIATSLDAYKGKRGVNNTVATLKKNMANEIHGLKSPLADASKDILAVKVLVKSMVKACLEEKVATGQGGGLVLNALVEEYRFKYPSLTRQMVIDGIEKAQEEKVGDEKSDEGGGLGDKEEEEEEEEGDNSDDDYELKLGRCMTIVDEGIAKYEEKIKVLKQRRESEASNAKYKQPYKKRSDWTQDELPNDGEPEAKKPRGRPKKDTPETRLVQEITDRYEKARGPNKDRLPHGAFEQIVVQARKDFGMEDFSLGIEQVRKRVTWLIMNKDGNYRQRRQKGKFAEYKEKKQKEKKAPTPKESAHTKKLGRPKRKEDVDTPKGRAVTEIYEWYAEERKNYVRLPKGTFEAKVEEAKTKHGVEDDPELTIPKLKKRVNFLYLNRSGREIGTVRTEMDTAILETKKDIAESVYERYRRAKSSNGQLPPGTLEAIVQGVKLEYGMPDVKMTDLESKTLIRFKREHPDFLEKKPSEDDKRKQRMLMNEATARYFRARENHPNGLPDGEMDRIIEKTKKDLGYQFAINQTTVRKRVDQFAAHPDFDAIDGDLVAAINKNLAQGKSVTRALGVDLAYTLLKAKKLTKDSDGKNVLLDSVWWKNFLGRNKEKLVAA